MARLTARYLFGSTLSVLACIAGGPSKVTAQESTPYLSSPLIEASPLPEEKMRSLAEFFSLPVREQATRKTPQNVCRPNITKDPKAQEKAQVALALLESNLAAEITLDRPEQGQSSPVSYTLEFKQQQLYIYSSSARYESERTGALIGYPGDATLAYWFESKGDASAVFFIPPLRECASQYVLMCPRTYNQARELIETPYQPTSVRYFPALKADGLFKAPEKSNGRIRASALASSRVSLPETWFKEEISAPSPASSFKLYRVNNFVNSQLPKTPVTIPFRDALEAHLEFGTPENVLRTGRSRNTVEVSRLDLTRPQVIRVEQSDIKVLPGACYLITSTVEQEYR
jgi:hypothetical protein